MAAGVVDSQHGVFGKQPLICTRRPRVSLEQAKKGYGTYRGKDKWLITKPDNCRKPGIPVYSFSFLSNHLRGGGYLSLRVRFCVCIVFFFYSLHRFIRSAVYRDQGWDFVIPADDSVRNDKA